MRKKKTQEEFEKEVFNLVGNEYKVLGEYVNGQTKIKMLHVKCGNEYYVTPSHFLSGVRCTCNQRKTHEMFVQEVYELVKDEYTVVGKYIDSKTKIKMLHKSCGKEYYTTPNNFLKGHRCTCTAYNIKKTTEKLKKEVVDLVEDTYQIMGEYIDTHTKIKILHIKCGNEFLMSPHNFLQGQRCPFCSLIPKQVKSGFNSMWDTNPELAKLLANPEDGYKYTQKSNKKVDWKCSNCGLLIKNKSIDGVSRRGLSCPCCSDGVSYPNRLIFSVLNILDIDFETEKSFKWCKYKLNNKISKGRYDFYFVHNNQEYIIEMDGDFHFKDNLMSGQTKEDSHQIDIGKDKLAIEHNILPIRIESRKSELEYIKTEILKSELKNVFDLSKIDWQECEQQSLTSLKIQACELWKEHHNIKTISNIMKRSKSTIWNWLKSCANIGLCDYVAILKRSVICIETNEFFETIRIASKAYNVDEKCISNCCRGRQKFIGTLPDGTQLHWRYAN